MVAYFRKQNTLFMLLGAALGFGVAFLFFEQLTASVPGYFKVFFLILPAFLGVVLGRIYAGLWAKRKLRRYAEMLYVRAEAEEFLKVFTPIVERTPKNTIDYVDGCNKLAYAHEALGRFEEALALMEQLNPEELKNHTLGGMALTCNQKVRLLLLQEKVEEAKVAVERLREIGEIAIQRAPALGRNTQECVRLYENWLAVLEEQPADEAYLEEEIKLSKNRIHKSEIQLVLAQAFENREEQSLADELRLEVLSTGSGLWAEGKARSLLKN